jgi:hypothetical protein
MRSLKSLCGADVSQHPAWSQTNLKVFPDPWEAARVRAARGILYSALWGSCSAVEITGSKFSQLDFVWYFEKLRPINCIKRYARPPSARAQRLETQTLCQIAMNTSASRSTVFGIMARPINSN